MYNFGFGLKKIRRQFVVCKRAIFGLHREIIKLPCLSLIINSSTMLSTVIVLSTISSAMGFSMMPKTSSRFTIKMAADPWFPNSATTNLVDPGSLE